MKDTRIRYNRAEREAVKEQEVGVEQVDALGLGIVLERPDVVLGDGSTDAGRREPGG